MTGPRPGHSALAALLAALLAADVAAQTQAPADPHAARLQAAFATAEGGFWGIAACAVEGKVVFCEARGQQDRKTVPIDRQSLFDLGGLADRITAIAALELLARKHWQLDDPIARVLSDWPKDKAAITWRHLLQHTSGLAPTADWGNGANAARRPAIAAIAATVLVDAPGHACHPSMLNGNLLALLVEQAAGTDFEEAVRRRVFAPAGMTGTGFLDDKKLDVAHMTWRSGTGTEQAPARQYVWDWGQRGARGVLTDIDDFGALAAALCGGKLLDERQLEALLAPLPGGDALRVQPVVRGGVEWTQLHGAVAGYRARLLLLPKARAWIALLAGELDLDALETALAGAIVPALPPVLVTRPPAPPAEKAPAPAPAAATASPPPVGDVQIARFLGVFELASGGRYEVLRDGDGVVLVGVGVQASARLQFGGWPVPEFDKALRQAEERSLAGLEPLVTGKGAPPPKAFVSDAALAAARPIVERAVAHAGKAATLQFAGTETSGVYQSWVRISGRGGAVWLRISWSLRGTIASVAESPQPAPFRAHFRIDRADWAVGTLGGAAATLSVEGQGASRTLVLEDRTGIAECDWVGDLR